MAKAPAMPSPTHFKFKVKAPIYEAGTQFVPGPTYTVKAEIYEKLKAVAVNAAPIIRG